MSGDSGRALKQIYGQSVRPEPVYHKSLTENVANIIIEVVSPNPSHYEGKEKIVWVKFDECDINDLSQYKEKIECNGNIPPFLLIIGYTNGVQIWVVQATGVAVEVLSLRQGPVRTVKILLRPEISNKTLDKYSLKRPIAAICDTASPGSPFHSVAFLSLLTGETQPLKTIKFKSPVQDIHSNKHVIVISFAEKLAVFEASTFDDIFTISTCYKSPGLCLNPVALGDQWLAFADRKLHNTHQSCGGVITESPMSYKSSVISVVKSVSKGLKDFGDTMATNFMGTKQSPAPTTVQGLQSPAMTPGIVTIIDTSKVNHNEVNLAKGPNPATIAHFVAHQSVPIVCMEFDPSGTLIATADKLAHNFNVFKVYCHPSSSSSSSIHHLYSLYRGDTTAKVVTMTFSLDSRWLAVATHRGTTHIYPIAPYGGTVSMRTHKSLCVVNKLTRFQRSAGLDDNPSSGRNSPVLSSSPGTVKVPFENSPNVAYHNPFYPPYPSATTIKAIGRVKQPDLSMLLEAYGPGHSPTHSPPCSKSSKATVIDNIMKVSLCFGATRGWIAGSPTVVREVRRQPVDSLFVMGDHGYLIEYTLRVKPHVVNIAQDKIRDDETPLELDIQAYAQWPLLRETSNVEIRLPLHRENPLLIPMCAQIIMPPASGLIQDQTNLEEKWMAQVEIQTYTGPNRRLWMGPQYSFKTISQSGNLASVDILDSQDTAEDDDPSLEFPPRSSPVNIGSKHLVYIEAQSHSNSVESDFGESEKLRTKSSLKEAIADAMNDTHRDHGSNIKDIDEEYSCDGSDVLDITCDPVGPSTDYPIVAPQHFSLSAEDQLQAVTTKLRQVAVTNEPVETDCSHWDSRTPSLGDYKGITSSGEEFDLPTSFDPPLKPMIVDDLATFEQWTASDEPALKSSWGPFVIESTPTLVPPSTADSYSPMITSNSKSATTSEDDLWASKESKKDRKRRRKRTSKDQDPILIVDQPSSFHSDAGDIGCRIEVSEHACMDVDVDHFHTAEEFPEQEPLMMQSIHEDPDDLQRALEEASSDESNQPVRVAKGDSRASGEGQADEMFPFRETSSDEDVGGNSIRVRRRPVAIVSTTIRFDEEEDDRETSGEDRKTTSESDVTTSPNPRMTAASKNKKKKKKKK